MKLNEDTLEEICYKRDFLKSVIARVDFVNPLEIINKQVPKDLADLILRNFPLLEPRKAFSQELKISPKGGVDDITKSEFQEWHFHGKNREKTLTLTHTSIIMNYRKFNTYRQMRNEFFDIIELFFKIFSDVLGSRLGLRYINEISLSNGNPFEWEGYINSKLLGLFNVCEDNNSLSRIFHNLEYNYGDYNLKFQFGMHNPDYPANIVKKVFILDYDAYYQGVQVKEEILSNLDKFHTKIQQLFEYCIDEKLRKVMYNESV